MLNYEGRLFRSAAHETADAAGRGAEGRYHQDGNVVWADFAGGSVIRGTLLGTCGSDGTLDLAYCQLLADGSVIAGQLTSVPTVLDDGRIMLHEHWERFGSNGGTGVSVIEESPDG